MTTNFKKIQTHEIRDDLSPLEYKWIHKDMSPSEIDIFYEVHRLTTLIVEQQTKCRHPERWRDDAHNICDLCGKNLSQ